jgi:type I restriction enzyme, S subunit
MMPFIAVPVTEFKNTDAGMIPCDWTVKLFGDVATLQRGKDLPTSDRQSGDFPIIGSNGIVGYHNEYFVEPCLTVGRSGSVGKVTFYEGKCWALNTALWVKDFHGNSPDFLYHFFQTFDFARYATGVSVPTLNRNYIHDIPIPLPPLAEQQRIAAVLNTLQEEIVAQEDVIAAAKDFKRSLMQHLFTYGPGSEPAPTKMTEIGEIPAHWEVVEFGRHLDIVSGQVDPRIAPYRDMIHIGPEHIESGTGRILEHKTSHELGIRSGNYLFSSGHILYSKIRPYLNKVAMATFDGVCSADIYPIRADDKYLVQEFVIQFLLSDYFLEQATAHQQRTGIPKINREQLRTTLIPLPLSLAEQQEVANLLEAVDEKIVTGTERRAALRETYLSLLHQLMTGQIRLQAS